MVTMLAPERPTTALGPSDPDDGDLGRQTRGMAIAALVPIKKVPLGYKVPSQSGNGSYIVNLSPEPYCSCPDWDNRHLCKHVYAVSYKVERDNCSSSNGVEPASDSDGSKNGSKNDGLILPESQALVVPTGPLPLPSVKDLKPKKPTFHRDWNRYNNGEYKVKPYFAKLLRELCDSVVPVINLAGPGRPRLLLSDVVFACAVKVREKCSGRDAVAYWEDYHEKGYLSQVPAVSSVYHYMEQDYLFSVLYDLVIASALPLKELETEFGPDSTGFSSSVYDSWFSAKWGREISEAQWTKLHMMAGLQSHIVTVAMVSDKPTNDSPYLPGFLDVTNRNFQVKLVAADKGYLSKPNLRAIYDIGAAGRIPFKSNSTADPGHHKRDYVWEQALHFFQSEPDEFNRLYHRRSNAESVFTMIKRKLGATTYFRKPEARINEVMLKVLCHNLRVLVLTAYKLDCHQLLGPGQFHRSDELSDEME